MDEHTVPYWFLFGFFTAACWLLAKFVEHKFFNKEDKWTGDERRSTVVVDEHFLERAIAAYEKHVIMIEKNTEALSKLTHITDRTEKSTEQVNDALDAFIFDFKRHHKLELENQALIKLILPNAGPQ